MVTDEVFSNNFFHATKWTPLTVNLLEDGLVMKEKVVEGRQKKQVGLCGTMTIVAYDRSENFIERLSTSG